SNLIKKQEPGMKKVQELMKSKKNTRLSISDKVDKKISVRHCLSGPVTITTCQLNNETPTFSKTTKFHLYLSLWLEIYHRQGRFGQKLK
ncbi:hypothetical protein KIN20_023075, partial [Parelaphostrongylus tenuis]